MLLNEYEIEFMFRKIRNIRNLGNFHIRGPHIVMSRTDAQNGLDFHFNIFTTENSILCQQFLILCFVLKEIFSKQTKSKFACIHAQEK
jgi:hypothetical protein